MAKSFFSPPDSFTWWCFLTTLAVALANLLAQTLPTGMTLAAKLSLPRRLWMTPKGAEFFPDKHWMSLSNACTFSAGSLGTPKTVSSSMPKKSEGLGRSLRFAGSQRHPQMPSQVLEVL